MTKTVMINKLQVIFSQGFYRKNKNVTQDIWSKARTSPESVFSWADPLKSRAVSSQVTFLPPKI